MYLRLSTVKRNGRVYRYAQLVESVRRKDGKPTNRVIASLGALSDEAIAGIRQALACARGGEALVLAAGSAAPVRARTRANLPYLDLAVLHRVWQETGLPSLLEAFSDGNAGDVSMSDCTMALVLQRCVDAGSKLYATRWYRTTALPEILGLQPEQFNNSRVHRVLRFLDEHEAQLQESLPSVVSSREGAFSTFFIDATDTWFVGRGPPLAAKGIDKEGIYRRRVGLVMLCDRRGFPLRWHTLSGRYHDGTALAEMAKEAATLSWVGHLPIVVDRALGRATGIVNLHDQGVRYVTAVSDPELEGCGAPIPWAIVDALRNESDAKRIEDTLLSAGFHRVGPDRYTLDLGHFDKMRPLDEARTSQARMFVLRVETLERETGVQQVELARQLGLSTRQLRNHHKLLNLGEGVRQRILAGEADALSYDDLELVAGFSVESQDEALSVRIAAAPRHRLRSRRRTTDVALTHPARGVLILNPIRLLEDRAKEEENLAHLVLLVDDLNRRLAHPTNRRTDASALAEIEAAIRRYALGNVCSTRMKIVGGARRVVLDKDEAAWARRRRGDGVNLIVAHPEVPGTADELVALYFAKDAIEKDFQTIKSVVALRPIRHRTDSKLRAHVTICVLALLLERLLSQRLRAASKRLTFNQAMELLKPIHLNLLCQGGVDFYNVTEPGDRVSGLLKDLGFQDLLDDEKTAARITPRASL